MTISVPVRGPHKLALGLFLLVWFSAAWFGSWHYNPNNATRLFAAVQLVEKGEATIDPYQTMTIDKAEFGEHYYLDKAPGMTLMAMPVVWLADKATGTTADLYAKTFDDPGLDAFIKLRFRLAVALTVATLTAFAAVLLFDLATGITGSPQAGLITALGYALATPVWGWSTTMFGHAPVGALLLIATWAIWRGTSGARELGRWRYPVMAGAALGWGLVIEYPIVFSALPICLWVVWRTRTVSWPVRVRLFGLAAAAGLVALVPLVLYNEIAFGVPFKIGYEGVVGFNGMNQGLFGLTYPKIDVLWQLVVGPARGLLWVAPLAVIAPFGIVRLIRAAETRDLGWLAAAIILAVLLYNSAYVYWDGGSATGPRHSIPMVGFLALGLAPLWRDWRARGRGWIAGLVGCGMLLNLVIAATEITAPHDARFPILDPILKNFFKGLVRDVPGDYWGWPPMLGLVPYLLVAVPLLWWLVREASTGAKPRPAA
jgi:4-amino-4-deoxy-L-arabinose transferase-like glycosyltransferase